MNESLKKYLASLPSHHLVEQEAFHAHLKDVAETVVPEIDRKLQEQRRLNAESRVLSVMRPASDRD